MRVLIVEDDGGSRAILEEHVRARGWHVQCATNPAEAERVLEGTDVDLILTDIHLPGAGGTEHVRRFCSMGGPGSPGSPGVGPLVVVMTGFPSLETCLDSIQHGAAAYLVKPFKVSEFIDIAERAHAERACLGRATQLEERVRQLELELSRLRPTPGPGGMSLDAAGLEKP